MATIRRRRRGRHTTPVARRSAYDAFTRSARTEFYKALEQRMPIRRACELAGFSIGSYYNWMERGKDPTRRSYHVFRLKVLRIRANKEQQSLNIIEDAAKGGRVVTETKVVIGGKYGRILERKKKQIAPSWEAAAWWLSRAHSKHYSTKGEVEEDRSPRELAQDIRDALTEIEESIPE